MKSNIFKALAVVVLVIGISIGTSIVTTKIVFDQVETQYQADIDYFDEQANILNDAAEAGIITDDDFSVFYNKLCEYDWCGQVRDFDAAKEIASIENDNKNDSILYNSNTLD